MESPTSNRLAIFNLAIAFCVFFGGCSHAQAKPPRVARWDWFDHAAIAYLQQAGITHLILEGEAGREFTVECEKAGIKVLSEPEVPGLRLVSSGKWPGLDPMVQAGPSGGETATSGATGQPWIDSNGWLLLLEQAVRGGPVLLSYNPPKNARLRPGSLELAVADAAVFGGHVALKLDDRLRRGLASNQPRAAAEWKRVAEQLRFAEGAAFQGTPAAAIAVVVEKIEPAEEVINLLLRRNLPVAVIARKDATAERLSPFAVAVAVGQPPLNIKGPALVERDDVVDPWSFGDDVRKQLGDKRQYQFVGGETVISYPRRLDDGSVAIHLVNYAIDPVHDLRLRLAGSFSKAQLLAPGSEPVDLPLQAGDVVIPDLRVSAVLLLK